MSETLTSEDRLDIKQRLVLWGQYEDRGDSDAWAALFTPDGRCTYNGGRTVEGREALAQASRERWAKPESRRCIHWMGDAVIVGTGQQAEVSHVCLVLEQTAAGLTIKAASQRDYVFVRQDGQWLIQTRRYTALPREAWTQAQP